MSPTASLRRFTATTGSGGSNGGWISRLRIRREIGECLKEHPRLRGELWLERGGSRYRLEFDCDRCEMSLVDCTKTKL